METTTTTLGWAFYYMLKHPEIQQKVQQELDNIVGQREVTLKDRDSLPYTGKIVIQTPQKYIWKHVRKSINKKSQWFINKNNDIFSVNWDFPGIIQGIRSTDNLFGHAWMEAKFDSF